MAAIGLIERTATWLAALPRRPRIWRVVARAIGDVLPKGLYARSLIIIIAPVVLLQSVIAYTFMERHWQLVTRRLSAAVTADVAALIDIYESYPQDKDSETLTRIANDRLNLDVDILKGAKLPPPARARSSRSSTKPSPKRSAARSAGPTGSIRWAAPASSRSGSRFPTG